jgi:hypothetical protein
MEGDFAPTKRVHGRFTSRYSLPSDFLVLPAPETGMSHAIELAIGFILGFFMAWMIYHIPI